MMWAKFLAFWKWVLALFGFQQPPTYPEADTGSSRPSVVDMVPTITEPASLATLPVETSPVAALPVTAGVTQALDVGAEEPPKYRKSKSILTYRETVLYHALLKAIDGQHQLLAKVRLADFVWLGNEPENRKFHQNQILCKHIDFLLCDKESLAPLVGIELDDLSHKRPDHHERDKFKDELFASVGLPLLRFELQSSYSTRFLREKIAACLPTNSVDNS